MVSKDSRRYDVCPVCGEPKRKVAKTCKRCQRLSQNSSADDAVHTDLLSDAWLSEFRGLFLGEGTAMIIRNNSSFSPELGVALRSDDRAIIEDIQRRLGGKFMFRHSKNPKHGDVLYWVARNVHHVRDICVLILDGFQLQGKKINDIRQVLDFCEWRLTLGRYLTEAERSEAEHRMFALRESRAFCPS